MVLDWLHQSINQITDDLVVTQFCWSLTLSMVLLATGDVERRTSLLADRSRSRSLATRTASRSNRFGSENLDEWPEERTPRLESPRSSNSCSLLANSSLDEADPPALRRFASSDSLVRESAAMADSKLERHPQNSSSFSSAMSDTPLDEDCSAASDIPPPPTPPPVRFSCERPVRKSEKRGSLRA